MSKTDSRLLDRLRKQQAQCRSRRKAEFIDGEFCRDRCKRCARAREYQTANPRTDNNPKEQARNGFAARKAKRNGHVNGKVA